MHRQDGARPATSASALCRQADPGADAGFILNAIDAQRACGIETENFRRGRHPLHAAAKPGADSETKHRIGQHADQGQCGRPLHRLWQPADHERDDICPECIADEHDADLLLLVPI